MSVIVYFQPNYQGPGTEIRASPNVYQLAKPLGSIRISQNTKVTFIAGSSTTTAEVPKTYAPVTRGIGDLGTYTNLITAIKVEIL